MIEFIFDDDLVDEEPVTPVTRVAPVREVAPVKRVTSVAPAATSTVRTGRTGRTFLTKPPEKWTWSELRDYVISKITERDGSPGPRNEDGNVEFGVFSRFAREFGEQAGPIAKFAFETCEGYWKGSPVGVKRFMKGSDDFFAREILVKHLSQKVR